LLEICKRQHGRSYAEFSHVENWNLASHDQ
jgi:hypothetical protein